LIGSGRNLNPRPWDCDDDRRRYDGEKRAVLAHGEQSLLAIIGEGPLCLRQQTAGALRWGLR